jgi:putative flippase GtrA
MSMRERASELSRTPDTLFAPQLELAPVIEVTVPVFNEQAALEANIRWLHTYLLARFPFAFHITIADNASTDATPEIAARLERELSDVTWLRLEEKGRGRALRAAWSQSDADVLCYMDVDLSTDLDALLPLVAPLVSGHSDLAIGTRLSRGARVSRGAKRELISRSYNLILKASLRSEFSDAQCGFKAIRREAATELLPAIEDNGWFFDTEMLVLAERRGLRIHEVPVDWEDDPDTRVAVIPTAVTDLRGVARMQARRQVWRFAAVGVASTALYLVMYSLLRRYMPALDANALTLFATAVLNTTANRRFTFARRGRQNLLRHQLGGLGVFTVGLVITSVALWALEGAVASPTHAQELVILVVANAIATITRFVLLRSWVFRPNAGSVA